MGWRVAQLVGLPGGRNAGWAAGQLQHPEPCCQWYNPDAYWVNITPLAQKHGESPGGAVWQEGPSRCS